MSKLDETKETLNNLRAFLAIACAMIIATVSGTITAQASNYAVYFWIGVGLTFVLIFVCGFILYSIKNKTREIRDL